MKQTQEVSVRTSVNAFAAGEAADAALKARQWNEFIWTAAVNRAKEQEAPSTIARSSPDESSEVSSAAAIPSSLPPDWVIQRESGGDYNAYNPTGCDGGCIGRYQFSEAWRGKLGLPLEGWPTPEQQDAAARELWANGAGCSHWAAC